MIEKMRKIKIMCDEISGFVDEVRNEMDDFEAEIARKDKIIEDLKDVTLDKCRSIADLEEALNDKENEVDRLERDVHELEGRVSELNGEIDGLRGEIGQALKG